MFVLGISCYFHDAAAALLKDGVLLAAAEEERFTRRKHDYSFPQNAIDYCLRVAGIEGRDVDYVVFYEKPFVKLERILLTSLQSFPRSLGLFREAMLTWLLDKLWVKGLIKDRTSVNSNEQILFSWHHLSHAASAFFCSPFEEAAILTVDAVGEWTTTLQGRGEGSQIHVSRELHFPHSLGLLYSAFTAFCGLEVNEGEYKLMGMAPYGEPKYVDKIYKLVDVGRDGSFSLDMDYFAFHRSSSQMFSSKFVKLFGEPKDPKRSDIIDPYYADMAASIQEVTEEILLKMANHLHQETGLSKLCMAGGVALNSVANGRILRETPFEEIYIQPASGDGGGALGAALYAYHMLLNKPRSFVMEHAYWGQEYDPSEIRTVLDAQGASYVELSNDDEVIEKTVDLLQNHKVVGWFQGGFEYGPRALGNRSILADPRQEDMKDLVNRKIKFREPFRPFAPSVVAERTEEFFALPNALRHYPARFMLLVVDVKNDKRDAVPAITHVDGTARPQAVFKKTNERYYRLIQEFGEATGVPVVLNTSFNLKGEPIVNTPADALSTFMRSGMDALVLDRFLVTKSGEEE
ncbi:MAG: carbamoyltransferase [Chloroflexota bacterium]